MSTDYLSGSAGRNDLTYNGYSYRKVYSDADGKIFEHGLAKYEVSYCGRVIGYADTETAADELYRKHRGFASKR